MKEEKTREELIALAKTREKKILQR